jgi:hypothetical protein
MKLGPRAVVQALIFVLGTSLSWAANKGEKKSFVVPASEDNNLVAEYDAGSANKKILLSTELCAHSSGRLAGHLGGVLEKDPNEEVRAAAAAALVHCGDKDTVVSALEKAMKDSSAKVRGNVMRGLNIRGRRDLVGKMAWAEMNDYGIDDALGSTGVLYSLKPDPSAYEELKGKLITLQKDDSQPLERRFAALLALVTAEPSRFSSAFKPVAIRFFEEQRVRDDNATTRRLTVILMNLEAQGRNNKGFDGAVKNDLAASIEPLTTAKARVIVSKTAEVQEKFKKGKDEK